MTITQWKRKIHFIYSHCCCLQAANINNIFCFFRNIVYLLEEVGDAVRHNKNINIITFFFKKEKRIEWIKKKICVLKCQLRVLTLN